MTERDPSLEPFDALIGTWATEATRPAVDAVVPGTVAFEWWEGGHVLLARSRNEHELFPGVSLDGVLRFWRDHPGFEQRFSATLGHDSFEGLWQLAETPGDWHDDLKVTYRRDREMRGAQ